MIRRFWQWLKDRWFLLHLDVSKVKKLLSLDPVLTEQILFIINDPVLMAASKAARQKALADPQYNQANEWLWDAEIAEWTRIYLQEAGIKCSRSLAWLLAAFQKAKEKDILRGK